MQTRRTLFRIVGAALVAFPLLTAVSCSEKSQEDTNLPHRQKSWQPPTGFEDSAGDTNPEHDKKPDTAKVAERSPSVRNQRIQSAARSLDQLELERRAMNQTEGEAKAKLNGIRGVPATTAIDIFNPAASKNLPEEEQQAFEEYLLSALKLQELDAKEAILKQQLERAQSAQNSTPDKGRD